MRKRDRKSTRTLQAQGCELQGKKKKKKEKRVSLRNLVLQLQVGGAYSLDQVRSPNQRLGENSVI